MSTTCSAVCPDTKSLTPSKLIDSQRTNTSLRRSRHFPTPGRGSPAPQTPSGQAESTNNGHRVGDPAAAAANEDNLRDDRNVHLLQDHLLVRQKLKELSFSLPSSVVHRNEHERCRYQRLHTHPHTREGQRKESL